MTLAHRLHNELTIDNQISTVHKRHSVSESRGEVNILLSTEIALVDSSGHS